MIDAPTVFIVGAGASASYGFPPGAGLVDHILAGKVDEHVKQCGIAPSDLDKLKTALRESACESIDAFLEHRSDLLSVGKLAIAACITEFEQPGNLGRFKQDPHNEDDDWLRVILAKMGGSVEEFTENQVSFVTYNYDRSIEQYLLTAIKARYNLQEPQAQEALSSIDIVHVHGSLGSLQSESRTHRRYRADHSPASLERAADSIRIISEKTPDDSTYQQVGRLIETADRVVFIGFGYHPENMKRLWDAASSRWNRFQTHRLLGSAYGLEATEIDEVKNRLDKRIMLGDPQHRCKRFLRASVPFFTSGKR